MLTTLLVSLASAQAAGPACSIGGAFVGVQGGYNYLMLKKEQAANPITEAQANKFLDVLTSIAGPTVTWQADDTITKSTAIDDKGIATVVVDISGIDFSKPDVLKAVTAAFDAERAKLQSDTNFKKLSSIASVTLKTKDVKMTTDVRARLPIMQKNIADQMAKLDDKEKAEAVKQLVQADAEIKFNAHNGFAGVHAGYLGRINPNFLLGGLVEGNWVFGQKLRVDTTAISPETTARINLGIYLRAMFNLTESFMAGADLGFSGQEIRTAKAGSTTDKESKWFWNPAARVVLGLALTENVLATAYFGGVFPMLKQDHFLDKTVKAKYSNFHGGIGISYAFGG